jgi:hypothetical protein
VQLDSIPHLERLVGLAHRSGVDIRPTLLRVLTDLYVQKPSHTREEEQHYTELALRLIDAVDVPTRAAVARRLAGYSAAPQPVLARLAADVPDVAAAVAELPGQSPSVAQDQSIGAPDGAPGYRSFDDASDLAEVFFQADPAERRLILVNLEFGALEPVPPPGAGQTETIGKLESAALARDAAAFSRALAGALGVTPTLAVRIAQDRSGEPIVAAARALGMPGDVLQRILLFLNPAVGHSVRRVYDLSDLFAEITSDAAARLVAIWRDSPQAAAPRRATHRPLHYDDEPMRARAGATPSVRRYSARFNEGEERRSLRR